MPTCTTGHDNPDAARFCSRCGEALTAAACSNGHPILRGASYCGRCGEAVAAARDTRVDAGGTPAAASPRRPLLIAVFVAVLVAGVVVVVLGFQAAQEGRRQVDNTYGCGEDWSEALDFEYTGEDC